MEKADENHAYKNLDSIISLSKHFIYSDFPNTHKSTLVLAWYLLSKSWYSVSYIYKNTQIEYHIEKTILQLDLRVT